MRDDREVTAIGDAEALLANDNLKSMLDAMMNLSTNSGMTVVQHGARLAVIGELLAALLEALPVSLCQVVEPVFRQKVDVLMAGTDDRPLPQQYHTALLTEVNRYLNALRAP